LSKGSNRVRVRIRDIDIVLTIGLYAGLFGKQVAHRTFANRLIVGFHHTHTHSLEDKLNRTLLAIAAIAGATQASC